MTRSAPGRKAGLGRRYRAQAAADLAGQPRGQTGHEVAVVAASLGRVEVDDLHERIAGEALRPGVDVAEAQRDPLPLDELDDGAAHQVDGGDQHGNLTGIPRPAR